MTFFYNLNKKLDEIRATPELTHGQLNERDMSRAAKGYEKYGKEGMEALAKAGREGKALDPVRNKYDKYDKGVEEGIIGNVASKVGGMAKKLGGAVLDKVGHGSDADMIRDLQRKMGVPQTGEKPTGGQRAPIPKDAVYDPFHPDDKFDAAYAAGKKQVKEKMSPAKSQSFAALAPPKDKITFADKIAGAKKEVDEMLGDVAAEAIKGALSGKQKKLDKNNNGKLDANDFAMLRKGAGKQETDEGWDDMVKDVHRRAGQMKPGEKTQGHKGEIEKTATGIRHTRRYDDKTGETDTGDDSPASGEKRGRGRPKKAGGPSQERVTAKSRKSDRTTWQKKTNEGGEMKQTFAILDDTLIDQISAMNGAEVDPDAGSVETWDENTARQLAAFAKANPQRLKQTQSMNTAGMKPMARAVGGTASGPEYNLKEEGDLKTAMKLLKKAGYKITKAGGQEELDEKAVSKKQQKFMGMVHATQKGEKAPSKEVAKVAKTMKKGDAEDFASTKHKGLPEKKKPEAKKSDAPKKKEKTTEAGGTETPTASSGFSYGKGIYDSMNRDLENMIKESMSRLDESMNVSMNMNSDAQGGPSKSLTVTATDDDALKLGTLLKNAGLGDGSETGGDSVADEIRSAIDGHGDEHGEESCPSCGTSDCGCDEVDEAYGDDKVSANEPDWPTNQEGAQDNFEYSGGLNKPKSTGQSTIPVLASQEDRQATYEDDSLARIREMAGIAEAKKPDANKDGIPDYAQDGKGSKDLGKAKDKEKKVDEGILTATANLWKEYKVQAGV